MEFDLAMKKLLLVLAFILAPSFAWAQCTGVFPPSSVCGTTSSGAGVPQVLPLASFALTPAGVSGNIQTNNGSGGFGAVPTASGDCTFNTTTGVFVCTKTNGISLITGIENNASVTTVTTSPTISSANCGAPIALGGNAFYTTTVGSASGFPAGCVLTFINTDNWPTGSNCSSLSGGRAKTLSVSGLSTPLLWPQQLYRFRNINNTWYQEPAAQRVIVPVGQKFCIDGVNGNDTNDGFGAGSTAALKTLNKIWNYAFVYFTSAAGSSTGGNPDYDWRIITNSGTCIVNSPGTWTAANCTAGLHFGGTPPGTEGHNAIMVECDAGSATSCVIADPSGGQAIGIYGSASNVEVQNITLCANGNNLIQVEGGMVRIENTLIACEVNSSLISQFNAISGGRLILDSGAQIQVAGGTNGYLAQVFGAGSSIVFDQQSISFLANTTYGQQTLDVGQLGLISVNGVSWQLNSHTVTAANNIGCVTLGIIVTSGSSASVPGTNTPLGTCTSSNNGNYN